VIYYLVAIQKFRHYVPGDMITDAKAVDEVLASDHARFVTRIAAASPVKGN
jgi:hypothetical protein